MEQAPATDVILTEENIINTYGAKQKENVRAYVKTKQLESHGQGYTNICRTLGTAASHAIRNWIYTNKIPIPIKTVDYLKKLNLIPLTKSALGNNLKIVLHCFAFIFGDGSISLSKKKGLICNLYGQREDLIEIKEKLTQINIKSELAYHPGDKGACYMLMIRCSPFIRLLIAMGAPIGNKTSNKYNLPLWLIDSNREIKSEFLSVLFGNELSTPSLVKGKPLSFEHIRFTGHKVSKEKELHLLYMNQLRKSVENLGIKTKGIYTKNITSCKKCGTPTTSFTLEINNDKVNLMRLYSKLDLKYAKHKQQKFTNNIILTIKYMRSAISNYNKYNEALILVERKGLGARKIGKIIELPYGKVSNWITRGSKPLYIENKEEIAELCDHIERKISEEESKAKKHENWKGADAFRSTGNKATFHLRFSKRAVIKNQ